VAFCRFAVDRLRARQPRSEDARRAASSRDKDIVGAASEAAAGFALYTSGKAAWARGPLRGGLSVFGAAPELDRCASQERYLAEKLAELSGAATGGAASLAQLAGLTTNDEEVRGAVAVAARYAARAARVEGLLSAPEFGEAWEEFAARTCGHRRAMQGIARAILSFCARVVFIQAQGVRRDPRGGEGGGGCGGSVRGTRRKGGGVAERTGVWGDVGGLCATHLWTSACHARHRMCASAWVFFLGLGLVVQHRHERSQ
jgi:hypothetical protein